MEFIMFMLRTASLHFHDWKSLSFTQNYPDGYASEKLVSYLLGPYLYADVQSLSHR